MGECAITIGEICAGNGLLTRTVRSCKTWVVNGRPIVCDLATFPHVYFQ
jgi:hypothetical protein